MSISITVLSNIKFITRWTFICMSSVQRLLNFPLNNGLFLLDYYIVPLDDMNNEVPKLLSYVEKN